MKSHHATLLWQRVVLLVMTRSAAALQRLSAAAADRFGAHLGSIGYRAAGRTRRRAAANLRLAFGGVLSEDQRETLVRRVFQHFGRSIVAFLRAPALRASELSQSVSVTGWEHVQSALSQGNGVVLITAHLGNWEMLGHWLARVQKIPLTVVAREPNQAAFAAYLRRMREAAGFSVLSKGTSARTLLSTLRKGEAICLLPDQNSGDLFVPFFGIPAGTVAGPASLALHTSAPLIPIYCLRNDDGTFQVRCHPPLTTIAGARRSEDIAWLTAQMNRVLESAIRQHPEQWLWLHNRWKSAFEDKYHHEAWSDEQAYQQARERWAV